MCEAAGILIEILLSNLFSNLVSRLTAKVAPSTRKFLIVDYLMSPPTIAPSREERAMRTKTANSTVGTGPNRNILPQEIRAKKRTAITPHTPIRNRVRRTLTMALRPLVLTDAENERCSIE